MGGFGAPFVLILLPGVIWASLAYVHGSASLMAGELKHLRGSRDLREKSWGTYRSYYNGDGELVSIRAKLLKRLVNVTGSNR